MIFNVYFLRFLNVSAADADALSALIPVLEGGGEVLFRNVWVAPSQMDLKVSWVRTLPTSCLLMVGNKKKSARGRCSTSLKSLASIQSFITAAVWTRALQWSPASPERQQTIAKTLCKSRFSPPRGH